MADQKQLKILQHGVGPWNTWRKKNPHVRPDLHGAALKGRSLRGANLQETDLTRANLDSASMVNADLRGANFREADLSRADLSGATITGANFAGAALTKSDLSKTFIDFSCLVGADLRGVALDGTTLESVELESASLQEASLWGTVMRQVKLARVRLNGAYLDETVFDDVDLSSTMGLDACVHRGPSVLSYRTLLKSGRLPLVFLRGCGLPERLIDYLPSLLNEPIQFYSCFISYSTKDQVFAERLHADLQAKGVRCWFAPHHLQGGRKLHEQIDVAIRVYDRLLLILSSASMNSEWVKTEISRARKKEYNEGRQVLFPIRLVDFEALRAWECFDADIGKDSAREIREYFIPDFSNWENHSSYQKALTELVRDLHAKATLPLG